MGERKELTSRREADHSSKKRQHEFNRTELKP